MARISLNCSCGWNFFIPGTTTGHEVGCPSCGQSVRIPGRKPGENPAKSAGEVAAEAQQRQGLIRYGILAAVVLIVGGVIGVWVLQTPAPPPPPEPETRRRDSLSPLVPVGETGKKTTTTPLAKIEMPEAKTVAPPVNNSPIIEEHKRGVTTDIWLINMTGLVSEVLRYRNLTAEWTQLQSEMSTIDGRIKNHLQELARLGDRLQIDTYLLPGDQIFGFAQRDFLTMKYRDAAAFLQDWMSKWAPSGNLDQLWFARADQKISIYVQFPTSTPGLQALVHNPSLGREGTPDDALLVVQIPVPAELIKDINGRFDALPGGYRNMIPAPERKKLEDLSKRTKAAPDDIEWMKTRFVGEALPAYQREADLIRSKALELESKVKENVGSDVIHMKDGRKIEGEIIEDTEEYVKVKARFGSVKIPKSEILKIEKGKGAALDFPAKFADAMKPAAPAEKLAKLTPLLAWCVEKNLSLQKEYVSYVILTQDASHEAARRNVNLARPK